MTELIERVNRMLVASRGRCVVCHGDIRPRDERLRLRGGVEVHRRCASYRMRQPRTGVRRLGYPPR